MILGIIILNRKGNKNMNKKLQSDLMLLLTAIIWGSAFVAQKAGAVLEPFTYNGIRMLIGGIVLIPVIFVLQKLNGNKKDDTTKTEADLKLEKKVLIIGGIVCGFVLFVASSLQQFGLYFDTDAGKAGFITSLYIVIVPVLGLFLKKKVRPIIWFCVALGAVGFYLLCIVGKTDQLTLQSGDFFVLLCSFAFSCHILVVDHFSPKCDGVKLSCIQFFVAGIAGLLCMAIFETPVLEDIIDCWLPILYCGVLSSGVAYTLQIIGQKNAEPTVASLIMSLESVFAVIFGVLLINETLTLYEGLGCIVIFIAVIISQLPSKEDRLKAKEVE
jgi:drug/metabolite transporter (DMT)-like permease